MSSQKRGRACTACASIKIKCQLGSDVNSQPPCERCVRLKKECTLSQPKRQKDRVAELEAQVASLTRLLQAQGIQDPSVSPVPDSSSDITSPVSSALSSWNASQANGGGKKRRLDATATDTEATSVSPGSPNGFENDISKLDRILTWPLQERVLERYINEVFPTFPMIPLPAHATLQMLRCDKPLLLLAIIYAASTSIVPMDLQESIASLVLTRLAETGKAKGAKGLEVLQAIQVVCIWYRAPKQHKHIALNQLIQLASDLADELGVGGPSHLPWVDVRVKTEPDPAQGDDPDEESIDCWRAWLVCYHLACSGSLFMRHPNKMQRWDDHHDQCNLYLYHSPYALPTDRWLSKMFRAERLCEQIATTLDLTDLKTHVDISDPSVKGKIQTCRNLILNWRVQTPQSLRVPMLYFWENLALAYMHEPVLHTPTNKSSFTAPYVADRLSLTDFPAPAVTEQHITAVYELTSALHAIIDTLSNWSTQELLGQSGLIVSSRATYANYVLVKLYVATTAPGNTLGSIMDAALLRFEEYSDKLINAASRIAERDDRCSPSRILGAAPKLREWYENYNTSLISNVQIGLQTSGTQFNSGVLATTEPAAGAGVSQTADWESTLRLADEYCTLDLLFGDPLIFDNDMFNSISAS